MQKLVLLLTLSLSLFAWDGYSHQKGNYIEVESYDHNGPEEGDSKMPYRHSSITYLAR